MDRRRPRIPVPSIWLGRAAPGLAARPGLAIVLGWTARSTRAAVLGLAAVVAWGAAGVAADAPANEPQPQVALPLDADKRPIPDYDGRGPAPTTPGEVALWVPRVLLSPLYFVSEFVVRRPLGAVVTAAERGEWLSILADFFTFGDEQKVGLVPTAYLEFGFDPSVGLYFFADDVLTDRNDVRVQGGMWPDDWWSLSVLDRYTNAADTWEVSVGASFLDRPDYIFHGIGPLTRDVDRSRFASTIHEAMAAVEHRPWRASYLRIQAGARHRTFDASTDSEPDDLSLDRAIRRQDHALTAVPPGFDTGYTVALAGLEVALDTRKPFPHPGHGLRMEARATGARDLERPASWWQYGGAVGGFVDLRDQRIVSLSLWADFLTRFRGTVPFTELHSLGGLEPMQGFRPGRLLGRSRAGMTFEYHWPVWVWLDMAFHYDVGNVFGAALEGFAAGKLRQSFGIGLRSARGSTADHHLSFQIGVGTDTFDRGSRIDTIRILFGGSRGFF